MTRLRNLIFVVLIGGITVLFGAEPSEECSLYPVDAITFKMVRPGGIPIYFLRGTMDPNYLEGPDRWVAKLRGRKAVVSSKGDLRNSKAGEYYGFENGIMVSAAKSGRNLTIPINPVSGTYARLFPDEEYIAERIEKQRQRDLWEKTGRLRPISGNPNKDGFIFATFLLLCLAGCVRYSGAVRYAYLAGAILSAVAVILTGSRGTFVGLIIGLVVSSAVLYWRRIRWRWLLLGLASFALLLTIVMCFHLADHYTWDLFSSGESDNLRLDIFRKVARMMVDAPNGWGWGKSGAAYGSWYRDLSIEHPTRTLVSSHLTWMVEMGDIGRFLYVFAWFLAGVWAMMLASSRRLVLPLACWLMFVIAAQFNPILEDWRCWIVPAGIVLFAVPQTVLTRVRLVLLLVLPIFGSALVMGGVRLAGRHDLEPPTLNKVGDVIYVNGDDPKVWIVGDEAVVGGWNNLGMEFQIYYQEHLDKPATGYVDTIEALPNYAERLVLCGRAVQSYLEALAAGREVCSAESILFLSPSVPIVDLPAGLVEKSRLRGAMGSLASRRLDEGTSLPSWMRVVPGANLYIPGWLGLSQEF